MCFCRDGYKGDPLTGCKPVDFCSNNPCGPSAKCNNFRGTFKCLCPPGTVGDAYTEGCKKSVECFIDDDCPNTAYCGEQDNAPKCKPVCNNNECGPNADCRAVNHKAVCKCRQGYEGDAHNTITGCRPKDVTCEFSSQCPPNTICDGGLCRRKFCLFETFYLSYKEYFSYKIMIRNIIALIDN